MTEFRVMLEGGDVLVVTIAVESAADAADIDPASFGESLLKALGLTGGPVKPVRKRKPAPVEEDPGAWLERTSRDSLKGM